MSIRAKGRVVELTLGREDFERARYTVAPRVHHTPILTSRSLAACARGMVRTGSG